MTETHSLRTIPMAICISSIFSLLSQSKIITFFHEELWQHSITYSSGTQTDGLWSTSFCKGPLKEAREGAGAAMWFLGLCHYWGMLSLTFTHSVLQQASRGWGPTYSPPWGLKSSNSVITKPFFRSALQSLVFGDSKFCGSQWRAGLGYSTPPGACCSLQWLKVSESNPLDST